MADLQAYLNRLASAEPTPGGGSAAALVGALGAALLGMVARITLASPKHAAVHADAVLLVAQADTLRARFAAAAPLDEAAYGAVREAQALPRSTPAERDARTARVQAALRGAAEAPLAVAELCTHLADGCAAAARLENAHLMSDVACALAFANAALEASAASVRINHRYLHDAALVDAQTHRLQTLVAATRERAPAIRALIDAQ